METSIFTIAEKDIELTFEVNIGSFEYDLEIQHNTDIKWILNINSFGDDSYYYIVYLTNLIRFENINELQCNVNQDIISIIDGLKPKD